MLVGKQIWASPNFTSCPRSPAAKCLCRHGHRERKVRKYGENLLLLHFFFPVASLRTQLQDERFPLLSVPAKRFTGITRRRQNNLLCRFVSICACLSFDKCHRNTESDWPIHSVSTGPTGKLIIVCCMLQHKDKGFAWLFVQLQLGLSWTHTSTAV